jgi:hypothetical protein
VLASASCDDQPAQSSKLRGKQCRRMTATGQVPRWRRRLPSVRFSLHCRHLIALPRTAAVGQEETLALQQTASLFDDLVGGVLKRERNGQAEHLGGLEVDDELKSGWLDHREIGRLLGFENAGRVDADLVINFVEVGG